MKILVLLWTACLVRFYSASWFSGKSKTDDKDAEIIAVEQPLKLPPPKDPKTLDLASLADSRYKTVDLSIDGIPARVYLVGPKEDINKVNYSGKDVWKASRFSEGEDGYNTTPEEICTYCITFIKGTGTAMILVEIHDLSIYREIFRYKQKTGSNGNESGWERSPTEYGKKIDALKINTDPPKKFTLDISSLEEGDEKFKLVKENKNDITTLFFATKQGYSIEKVVDGGKEICVLNESFGSFLCEVHSKGDHGLMRVHAEQRYIITFGWYEKKNSKWTDIKEKEFFKKLDEMRGVPNNASKSNTTHQLGGP
ncbi:signal peptide containing protein [Theileria equi strain WA]|uniref:Signal peptide containing protein n=1 Tax=Theileria equi strain WA TaxID=1537102 RepID=L1LAC9_THEEQ|nr:signal peptide containing protein [Theileria equi strain WA]EKX72432.1 signal peptide containing protein [Theileria equi strain WA]|eukprot:XP_004831884.1 signal peptide containing protein [Theileria equi strain WA]